MALPNIWNPWGGSSEDSNPWWRDPTAQQRADEATGQAADTLGNVWEGARGAASAVGSAVSDWWNRPPAPQPTVPEPDPSSITATPPPATAAEPLDPTTRGLLDAQTAQILSDSKAKAAEAALAEARVKEIEDKIARSGDPNSVENRAASIQLQTAQAQLARASAELAQMQNGLSPEQQIRLTDQLARERTEVEARIRATQDALNRQLQLGDRASERQFQLEDRNADRAFQLGLEDRREARDTRKDELQLQLWQDQRSLRLYELMLGQEDKAADRAMRAEQMALERELAGQRMGLDRERLGFEQERAAQDFQLRMMAQKVAEGELSAKKAFQKFQQWIEKQRLPSEIARNKSAAYAPFMPYLTSAKRGDIPLGFEAGGPMSRLVEMGGGAYSPQTYAINPVSIADVQSGNAGTPAPAPQAPAPLPSAAMPNSEVARQIQAALDGK